jgi:predicted nuclease with RNAse H fold
MIIVGIDLAGSKKRNTGICVLNEKLKAKCCIVKTDGEIFKIVENVKPDLIAVDAPFKFTKRKKKFRKKGECSF